MDMDSTLITIECIDEIADMQGLKPQVAAITEAAMRGEIGLRGKPDAAASRCCEGLPMRRAASASTTSGCASRPAPKRMLAGVQAAGLKTLLVSGGFTFFTDRVHDRLGLDYTHANVLEIGRRRADRPRAWAASSTPRKRSAPSSASAPSWASDASRPSSWATAPTT